MTPIDTKTWVAFGLIAVGAALAQLFPVVTPRDQSYHMTMVVLVPAALLLPTWLLPTVVVAQHVPEWLKVRYPWYIQTFNAGNYLLDLLAAGAVGRYLLEQDGLITNDDVRFAVAGLAAAVVLVLMNHAILAVMLRLGRGHSLRESGLFSFENLSTELVLAALGVLVAFAWVINPALIPFAVAPLLLFHRSLAVPQLEHEARLDPKTGLFNVRHFGTVLKDKLEHSLRTGEPLALLMIDLDLLREINNTYGHLAGDAVLVRVADVFRNSLRADDVAARFGGEEFVVLLPDTEFEDALALAERIRQTVGRQKISVGEIGETLTATVSIGIAMCPRDGSDTSSLIHSADLAVYRAKIQGRNRVVDGRVEQLGELRRTPSGGGRSRGPISFRSRHARRSIVRGRQRRRPCSTSPTAALGGPRHRPSGLARGHRADAARDRGHHRRSAPGRDRTVGARRTRRRRPGARTPGRGRRRVRRRCRSARRGSVDRQRRSGRARSRRGASPTRSCAGHRSTARSTTSVC